MLRSSACPNLIHWLCPAGPHGVQGGEVNRIYVYICRMLEPWEHSQHTCSGCVEPRYQTCDTQQRTHLGIDFRRTGHTSVLLQRSLSVLRLCSCVLVKVPRPASRLQSQPRNQACAPAIEGLGFRWLSSPNNITRSCGLHDVEMFNNSQMLWFCGLNNGRVPLVGRRRVLCAAHASMPIRGAYALVPD